MFKDLPSCEPNAPMVLSLLCLYESTMSFVGGVPYFLLEIEPLLSFGVAFLIFETLRPLFSLEVEPLLLFGVVLLIFETPKHLFSSEAFNPFLLRVRVLFVKCRKPLFFVGG
jgi:hypothetical protein